jgi:hypothetical protein
MRKHKKNQQKDTQSSLAPTEPSVDDIQALQSRIQELQTQNEQLFSQLHAKQREVKEAGGDSKNLRVCLTAEAMNLQHLAEISKNCLDKDLLPAHKWDQQARHDAYSIAARIIREAIFHTVAAPPPREGLLKAHQQIADYMNQACQEITGEDSSGPGIEKGHEFPPVPCPFCDKEPAKNWLSRHIKEEHPRRYDKWEREREENE